MYKISRRERNLYIYIFDIFLFSFNLEETFFGHNYEFRFSTCRYTCLHIYSYYRCFLYNVLKYYIYMYILLLLSVKSDMS